MTLLMSKLGTAQMFTLVTKLERAPLDKGLIVISCDNDYGLTGKHKSCFPYNQLFGNASLVDIEGFKRVF